MSNMFEKVKDKISPNKSSGEEMNIQPHPAKTNNPADLQRDGPGSGMRHDEIGGIMNAKQPFIPNREMEAKMGKPKTREELHAEAAALNKD